MRGCIILISFAAVFYPITPIPSASPLDSEPVPTASVHKKSGCIRVNHCKCIMMDGSGIIDLGALGDADGFLEHLKPLRSVGSLATTEVMLSFSPCQPFSEPEDVTGTSCTDVAACLVVRFHKNSSRPMDRYLNYGRHIDNQFYYNSSTKTLSVSYSVLAYNHPLTVVHYHCSPNRSLSSTLTFSAEVPLQIWVESPCACPNACTLEDVGPGTILLIILCLSATAYFILGNSWEIPLNAD
ncbi:uncharacterized protein LOC121715188 [Alosa sapidissima]|uniref:uncharacterized protein LOC121715188 n=1 Tax=Alosa sapidissima TaxID=34773 RepID=UPI001C0889D6|nr:uncharacterized protein LOC121715188 [Alosa sapidissima]